MRVVKSVSLPVELAEKASKLPNFSVFIQECLQHGADAEQVRQKQLEALRKRNERKTTALYRILNEPNWSRSAKNQIFAIIESSGVTPEYLYDSKERFE